MRKITCLAVCLLSTSVFAADEPRRLTTEQVINLSIGLRMFDGYKTTCKKNGNDEECPAQWKVKNGVRYTIALNLETATRIIAAFAKAREKMLSQYMLTGVDNPKAYAVKYKVTEDEANEQFQKFNADERAALDKLVDVSFTRITKADIAIDDNPYPPSSLALILPILD